MIRESLDLISEQTLIALCDDRVAESATLEFKRDLPDRSDKGRAELLKDVSALANARGGDIIYGISEIEGIANALCSIFSSSADSAINRLGQIIDSAIEPRVIGISFKAIELADEGYTLILRIPSSFAGPHRYHFNGHTRFVIRDHSRVRDMTFDEIRESFIRLSSSSERARSFRELTVRRIFERKTVKPLKEGPITLVQVMPVGKSSLQMIDVSKVYDNWPKLIMKDWGGGSPQYNLDGLVVYPSLEEDGLYSYLQVYRDGSIESISYSGHFSYEDTLPSLHICDFIRETITRTIALYKTIGVYGPVVIFVTLVNVEGHRLGLGRQIYLRQKVPADRPIIALPELMIEDVSAFRDVEKVIRPVLDILWQSFGIAACNFYDEGGNWSPPN